MAAVYWKLLLSDKTKRSTVWGQANNIDPVATEKEWEVCWLPQRVCTFALLKQKCSVTKNTTPSWQLETTKWWVWAKLAFYRNSCGFEGNQFFFSNAPTDIHTQIADFKAKKVGDYPFPVFAIGTPKIQGWVAILTKSYSLRCSSSIPSILSTACLECVWI